MPEQFQSIFAKLSHLVGLIVTELAENKALQITALFIVELALAALYFVLLRFDSTSRSISAKPTNYAGA